VNPVLWLRHKTGFKPFPHEEQFLTDHSIKTRVVRKARQVGMTTTISREAIWKGYTARRRVILFVSPSFRQSKFVMEKIQETVSLNPDLRAQIKQQNVSTLTISNGSTLISLPNSPDLIRGFTATDVYLDEAAHFINDQKIMAAVNPMLIASKGNLTVVSTPFGKRGLFYNLYKTAVDHKDISTNIKHYDFFPSTINPFVTEENVKRLAVEGNLTDLEVRQEYYGEFIEEVDAYYPMDLITACATLEPLTEDEKIKAKAEEGKSYYWGIDLAKKRDETVVYILVKTETDKLKVVYQDSWTQIDYSDQVGRLSLLSKRFPPAAALVDSTGVGEAVLEQLRDMVPNIKGVNFAEADNKFDLASRLRLLFEQQSIEIPNDRKLLMQLNSITYETSKIGRILFHSPEKTRIHDDHVWSLALAARAATMTRGPTLLAVK
jgi:phage FluMu gp28-like protein